MQGCLMEHNARLSNFEIAVASWSTMLSLLKRAGEAKNLATHTVGMQYLHAQAGEVSQGGVRANDTLPSGYRMLTSLCSRPLPLA